MDNRFLGLIERSMKEHWDLPAFSDYNGHTFHFKDVARRIEKFHILLEHAGIKKGDKVAIVGRNSSSWAICFFGILAYGAVAVPILHEFKPDNIHHIVNHSGAKAVLAGSSNWENMNEKMMPDVKLFMMLDNFSIIDCKNKEVRTVRDRINEYFGERGHDPLPQLVEQHAVCLRPPAVHPSGGQHRLYVTYGTYVRVSV